jgi:methylthioribose-1-phosphate isomerase
MNAIKFKNNRLFYLDQTQLPLKEVWRQCKNVKQGYEAIKYLKVRGAPLIGVFAAYCVCVELQFFSSDTTKFLKQLKKILSYLISCRPTAINLAWALKRLEKVAEKNKDKDIFRIKSEILKEAEAIHREDISLCKRIAEYGITLVAQGDRILTHCNAGFLATAGMGTALSIIYKAHAMRKDVKVYVDETRPLLQGSRLTAWELQKKKVPCEIICDSMAAYCMREGFIDKVFVGADRIAANGDTANKIGTYNLAVVARYHKVPFYVVAPFSTFDLSLAGGDQIPIEERNPDEVRMILGKVSIAPKKVNVFNPAFDVTPNNLITTIVSDKGIIYPPYKENIKKILNK